MNTKQILLFIGLFVGITINAQTGTMSEKLRNELGSLVKVKKVNRDKNKSLRMDGISVPAYTYDGEKVNEKVIIKKIRSSKFVLEFYANTEEVVKAIVLRPATEKETKEMKEARNRYKNTKKLEGQEIKAFSVTDINGNKYNSEDLKGKIIVINFWFIGCKPCVMEMPELNELVKNNQQEDVVFLAFALDNAKKVKSFLKKHAFDYQIIADSKSIANLYKIVSYPTHIVINKDSKITFAASGYSRASVKQLGKAIKREK